MLFNYSHLVPDSQDIMFAWRYLDNLSTVFYKPALVFKQFSHTNLQDQFQLCLCRRAKRFSRFLDPKTKEESSKYGPDDVYVRTMDISIVQHVELRKALSKGLNHVPLKPTNISVSLAVAFDAFLQFLSILNLDNIGFPVQEASIWFRDTCLSQLKAASKRNKFGFRFYGPDLLKQEAVKNEIQFLTSHLYCTSLDKASNNACFVCIKHVRLLALERLNGSDFSPCKENGI
jgi:hypothetical protein